LFIRIRYLHPAGKAMRWYSGTVLSPSPCALRLLLISSVIVWWFLFVDSPHNRATKTVLQLSCNLRKRKYAPHSAKSVHSLLDTSTFLFNRQELSYANKNSEILTGASHWNRWLYRHHPPWLCRANFWFGEGPKRNNDRAIVCCWCVRTLHTLRRLLMEDLKHHWYWTHRACTTGCMHEISWY